MKQLAFLLLQYSAISSSATATLTHLFLLVYYMGVNVWAMWIVFNLYTRYEAEYRNKFTTVIIKVLLSVTIQNMVNIKYT